MRSIANRRTVLAVVLSVAAAAPAAAQVTLTPRALGMGGAYVAVARGNEALFLNPANLGLSGTPAWSLSFPQVAFGGTVAGARVGDLGDLIGFDDASDDRLSEILEAIPAGGMDVRYDLRAPLVALQNGNFAVGLSYGSVGEHSVGRDLVELLFFGYEEGRTDYSVGNTRGSRLTYWDVAAAYGRRVGPVSLGVTAHYLKGGTTLNSRLFEPTFDLAARDLTVSYRSVFARGGHGYGIDLGAAMQPTPTVTLSASVTNALGRMDWSDELYTRSLVMDRHDVDNADYMRLEERYEGSEERVDLASAPLEVVRTSEGLYDHARFPAVLNAGAAWQAAPGTVLAVGYRDRLTDGRLGDEWASMASLGVQQKLPVGTLQAGYTSNLDGGTMLSGGFSLGVLQFGVARLSQDGSAGPSRNGWIGTVGIGVVMSHP